MSTASSHPHTPVSLIVSVIVALCVLPSAAYMVQQSRGSVGSNKIDLKS